MPSEQMVRCPGLSLRAQVKGNSFGYFEHDPWVLSLETKGKLDQKIFVLFNPLFRSILQLLKGFLKKGRKLLIIDGHIWCWWLSAVSEGQLYIHERATHLNFYWYLMTDLKVVTVYSSSLETRHQSPHNMNFFSF